MLGGVPHIDTRHIPVGQSSGLWTHLRSGIVCWNGNTLSTWIGAYVEVGKETHIDHLG